MVLYSHAQNAGASRKTKKETYRTCKGSQARPSVQQAAFWKKLTKFPENMQLFLNAWRTTKQEADKKFERLPQQGIETNPGPIQSQAQPAQTTTGTQHNGQHNSNSSSSSSEQEESGEDEDNDPANIQHKDRSTCRVLTINTGGAPGVWEDSQTHCSIWPSWSCLHTRSKSHHGRI